MRFMIIRRADAETEAAVLPSTELIEKMTEYNEKLNAAGVLVGGDGLHPTSRGVKIKFNAGKPTVLDGPFAEAKELIAGYTLIEVSSREEAIEWVKQWPQIDGHGNVELELRQVYDAFEDFGDAFTQELKDRHAVMRESEKARG